MSRGPWLAALAWAAAILVGTSIPGHQLPPAFPYADKLVHLAIYGVLGALVGRAARLGVPGRGADRRALVRRALALAAFALFDEWHQDYIPGRSSDRVDWLADVVGATIGLVATTTPLRTEQRT